MKQKLEFPVFYLMWVGACFEMILSASVAYTVYSFILGVILLLLLALFMHVNTGEDYEVLLLMKPLMLMLGIAVVASAVVTRTPAVLCTAGVAFLILLRVERGYAYEYWYEP